MTIQAVSSGNRFVYEAAQSLASAGFKSVIYIDDAATNRDAATKSLSPALERHGVAWAACPDIESFGRDLTSAKARGPVLVLTDFDMPSSAAFPAPRAGGLEIVQMCFKESGNQLIFPIVVSGGPNHDTMTMTIKFGNSDITINHPQGKASGEFWNQCLIRISDALRSGDASSMLQSLRHAMGQPVKGIQDIELFMLALYIPDKFRAGLKTALYG